MPFRYRILTLISLLEIPFLAHGQETPDATVVTSPNIMGYLSMSLVVLLVTGIGMYNLLIRRHNTVENAFVGMDTQLMLRYDLIPNLAAVVKGYAEHKNETLRTISEMRIKITQTGFRWR